MIMGRRLAKCLVVTKGSRGTLPAFLSPGCASNEEGDFCRWRRCEVPAISEIVGLLG